MFQLVDCSCEAVEQNHNPNLVSSKDLEFKTARRRLKGLRKKDRKNETNKQTNHSQRKKKTKCYKLGNKEREI